MENQDLQELSVGEELRRMPIQRRARNTVEVILTAAERVLLDKGYEGLSTTQVAKVAGVGIGSLYQYFSGKRELVRSLFASQSGWFEQQLCELSKERLPRLGRLLLERRRRDRTLYRAAVDGSNCDPSFCAILQTLERCAPELTEVECFLAASAISGAVDRVALDRPQALDTAELEVALAALVRRVLPQAVSAPELVSCSTTRTASASMSSLGAAGCSPPII
ncbi:MAG: TetR/AcrR family transcriptional regulator [Polyangiaceae bacterium]|nr:TetR/AcrR family transcriptional regulator [Myxococcales bacterium]MCB9590025.1 TetR/AcrR family transcriptional regulator [Polyangiaceae bacterium]